MIQGAASRRKFLVASFALSGLISTGIGAAVLRASAAWAQSPDGNADALARMARLLFPHDEISDVVYAEVMHGILADAADDASMTGMLHDAVAALNMAHGDDWFEAGESEQIAAMQTVQGQAFFAAILGSVRARFYHHPKVWEHIKYPGSSIEFGGYLDRGFDDIDWLPEDA